MRKYVVLATMGFFVALMAIELVKLCTGLALIGTLSATLSYLLLPISLISCVAAWYLIFNNREIEKGEQKLGKFQDRKNSCDKEKCINYINAAFSTLVLAAVMASSIFSLGIIEDIAFIISSIIGFSISCLSVHYEHQKNGNEKLDKEKGHNISEGEYMLIGSSTLLIRKIILLPFLFTASITPPGAAAVAALVGLIGMVCFMVGYICAIEAHKKGLVNVKTKSHGECINIVSSTYISKNNQLSQSEI
ncbi:hypothetical protein [Wolbachia endosymbiont of Pentidionis agamae]|uniref:hypothetical protein n=1 Tax=Wolbachia endosymbiont of Pentidionis agamae TaxID=3110435 RepID=UPI002FD3FB08